MTLRRPHIRTIPRFAAALVVVALLPSMLCAQVYFGKNKVQYTSFDWQTMTTEHFRVYFYKDETDLAQTGASLAEASYRVLSEKFVHEVDQKIPLIIYSSPSYFAQTNVIPGLLPESVGGFTEFMKGRVVVPFNGSYADFAHVIRHELVHVFMISRLSQALDRQVRTRHTFPPLWFTEGIAEYWSKEWDTRADLVVRDMVITNRLVDIPHMYRINGTYYMYKLGESICYFIDSAYGRDKIPRLFDNWHKGRNFNEVVKITLGDDLKELSEKWEYSLKRRYFPTVEERGLPRMECRRITEKGFSEKGVPIRWDDGTGLKDWVIYKAHTMGYAGIYMTPAEGNPRHRKVRTLLKGERSADYESLHLLRSGIDANDSGLVVFSSKSRESDVLYVYDLREGEVTRRFEFDGLVEARSPRLSPTGKQAVFSGVRKDGYTNLYVLDLENGDYYALTDDVYHDTDPTFAWNGRAVIFASDRCRQGHAGALNLYEIDLTTHSLHQLTHGVYRDMTPESAPEGVYFSSDRDGAYNIFLRSSDGSLSRQSSFATAALDPRLDPARTSLTFTGYQDMGYQVYQMDLERSPEPVEEQPAMPYLAWRPAKTGRKYESSTVGYDVDYSFDIAQSTIGYDPVNGSLGGFQAAMSDVLGNRAYYLLLTNTAQTKDELLESFNIGVTYINRERRLNWGIGAFHLYDEYFNDHDQYYYERQAGAISLLSYPTSKFQRVDFTTLARYSKRESVFGVNEREAFLFTNYLSWVYDNSLWDYTGPLDGRRYQLSVGLTTSPDRGRVFSRQAMADVRHYFRLGRYSALANRLLAFTSAGREPQRIYLGGSWSFRGFDRRAFYNRNVLFASTELRFPLVDQILVGFPFGGVGFSGIRGALFFDAGSAWDDDFDQFLGSMGFGFRVALSYFLVLRFDFTRTTDFETISPDTDFDFFFGWNF